MNRKYAIVLVACLFLLAAFPVFAEDEALTEKEQLVCDVIQDSITAGNDISSFVRTGIQMGFDACFVMRCAMEGEGDLKQIVTGAVEAGSTTDVVARCAVNAGADVEKLAGIIMSVEEFSLCYLPPRDEVIPVGTSFPGGRDERRMSPSSF